MNRRFTRATTIVGGFVILSVPAAAQAPTGGMSSLDSLLSIPIETAAKYDQTQRSAPASTIVITSEEIDRFGYATLGELLARLPGFYASDDRNYFYLGVRGFSRPTDYNNRVLLLLDGHPLNENIYDSAFLGTSFGLDLKAVDRVEVVRGPGSTLYGSNAMFAVVNVIPKRGNDVDGVQITGGSGSFGTRRGAVTYGRKLPSGLDVTVTGSLLRSGGQSQYYAEFDDPESNNGLAQDVDGDEAYSGYASIAWKGLSVAGFMVSRTKDVPTAPWETLFNRATRTTDQRAFGEVRFNRAMGADARLFARAFVDGYNYHGLYPYADEDGGDYRDTSNGRWYGSEGRLLWDMASWNRFTMGGEVRRHRRADQTGGYGDAAAFDDSFPYRVLSGYVQDELQLTQDLTITVGARVDDYSTFGAAVSPRAAAVYLPRPTSSIKLLYGRAFRAPNLWEYRYEEEDWWRRNPELQPERVRTVELVWEERVARGLFTTVSLYDYRMVDLIDQVFDEAEIGQYQNVGIVNARGLEGSLVLRLASGVVGSASYAFQDARNREAGAELTNSPGHLIRARLGAPLSPWLFLAGDVVYDHERLTVYGTRTDAYFLSGATLTARLFGDRLEASLSARNLFDTSYQTPGGFEHTQEGIVQNGRDFRVRVSLLF